VRNSAKNKIERWGRNYPYVTRIGTVRLYFILNSFWKKEKRYAIQID
jgi:hypothetical protein